jgi:hypothetical protein
VFQTAIHTVLQNHRARIYLRAVFAIALATVFCGIEWRISMQWNRGTAPHPRKWKGRTVAAAPTCLCARGIGGQLRLPRHSNRPVSVGNRASQPTTSRNTQCMQP